MSGRRDRKAGSVSTLQARILDQIRDRFGPESVGQRINEAELAEQLGVSRTPVHEVLLLLAEQGLLTHLPRRGYVIAQPLDADDRTDNTLLDDRMMRDIAQGDLAGIISERSLLLRYDVSRGNLSSTLRRLMRDQLAEPSPGRGWVFVDIGETALHESYRFRRIVEPAAILSDDYHPDIGMLQAIDREHVKALERINDMDNRSLFALDADFHLEVIRGAGSRYLTDAVARQNNIRRLAELVSSDRRERIRQSMQEHRSIIAALLDGKRQSAAMLMTMHLDVSEQETTEHFSEDLAKTRNAPSPDPK